MTLEELPKPFFVTQMNHFLDNKDLVALARTNKHFYDVFLSIPYQPKHSSSFCLDKQTKLDQLTQSKSAPRRLTELELSNSSFAEVLFRTQDQYVSNDLSYREISQRVYQKWDETHQQADAVSMLSYVSNLSSLQTLKLTSFMLDSVVASLVLPNQLRCFSMDCAYINNDTLNHLSLPQSLQELFFINLDAQKLTPNSMFSSSLIKLKQLKNFNLMTPYSLPSSPLKERVTFLSVNDNFDTDKLSDPYPSITHDLSLMNENFNKMFADLLANGNLSQNIDQMLSMIANTPKHKKTIDLSQLEHFSNLETFLSLVTNSEKIVALNLPRFLKSIRIDCRGISSDALDRLKLPATLEVFGLQQPNFLKQHLNKLLAHNITFILLSPQNLSFPFVSKHIESLSYDKGDEALIKRTDFSKLNAFDHLQVLEIKAQISQTKINKITWPQSLRYLYLNCQLMDQKWLENWKLPTHLIKLTLENADLEMLTTQSTFLINFALISQVEILSPKSLPKFDLRAYNPQVKIEKDTMVLNKNL